MRVFNILLSSLLVLSLFTNCGSGRELQERAPAQFQDVYYTTDETGLNLHIPVAVIQDNRVSLDSIYFRGMRSELVQDQERSSLYIANFAPKESDAVMHEDPREEYGNRAPQAPQESPFKLNNNEAVLVFSEDGETKYYKITGIEEEEQSIN